MFFFVAAMVLGFARLPAAGPVSDDLRSLLEGCGRRRAARDVSNLLFLPN